MKNSVFKTSGNLLKAAFVSILIGLSISLLMGDPLKRSLSSFLWNAGYSVSIGVPLFANGYLFNWFEKRFVDWVKHPLRSISYALSFHLAYSSFVIFLVNWFWFIFIIGQQWKNFWEYNHNTIISEYLAFIIIAAIMYAISFFKAWRYEVQQKEEVKREALSLQYKVLQDQINPHFLFNSLNSVQNLVQQNKGREAHLYLADFAGLIRKVLNNSEKEEVSLAEELEMVQQYLSLEKLRFDFDYQINIEQNIDPHNTLVPSMLMQPFVENAITHGLQNKTGDRQLRIEASREESEIKIIIEDNGIGREAARQISKTRNGKGSKMMKERLEILQTRQGEKYGLKIIDLMNNSGTQVEISIPEER